MSRKAAVKDSRHQQEIQDCLESGWSPETVLEYLKFRWPDDDHPSLSSLYRWRRKHVPEAKVLPPALIQKKLKGLQYRVDTLKMLARILPLLEERLAKAMELEIDTLGGMPVSATDRALESYLAAVREYRKVAQDLGVEPKPPLTPLIADMREQNLFITDSNLAERLIEVGNRLAEQGGLAGLSIEAEP